MDARERGFVTESTSLRYHAPSHTRERTIVVLFHYAMHLSGPLKLRFIPMSYYVPSDQVHITRSYSALPMYAHLHVSMCMFTISMT